MENSKIIAQMIYKAYVRPTPAFIDLEQNKFEKSLELYAEIRMQEMEEERRRKAWKDFADKLDKHTLILTPKDSSEEKE